MTLDCLWRFKLNLRLHLISLPRLICASVRSGPIVIHGLDRSVGLRCFWIGLGLVRSKFILESVRSDSISKIVGPAHWTEPNRDRTDVVHPWTEHARFVLSTLVLFICFLLSLLTVLQGGDHKVTEEVCSF